MIRVLIVEDDPMVAELNKRYLEEIAGFVLVGIANNVSEALQFLDTEDIDLLLLDVYMPGQNGLELLTDIRDRNIGIDVILITAASNVEKIQTALRFGAVDYLIKPFEFERLQQSLLQYQEKFKFFHKNSSLNQTDLDDKVLKTDQNVQDQSGETLPKGLTKRTLQTILRAVKQMERSVFSTDEIAEQASISRVSVRKYLKFLSDNGVLEESLTYGIGRPVSLYKYKEENLHNLKDYL
ncbi:response regulator [Metabacillus arenae]|uniref:Response regulator n=1 Tax=Metabacillus arenae TaxID=2771434 RepID=A0A926NIM8_9BACI|nr:response regulator [Metabacillus arenae]MBD1382404.1 response regulator [Metabacillus arenae]